ncbi:cytidylyltransferase domain-containing protein [Streptomyces sp. TRM64462]|uniref:cytidylyltransferase domain-containing protein n=1 Tax=Streptomyces sp. TRM64462 TaxID=2741726 RepID=UPI0035CD1CA8
MIPARGGSKGVPGKNLAPVGGVPLVARAVRACRAARHVTHVAVSTDDPAVAAVARAAGAEVVDRPASLSGDTATSEAAVLHALDTHESRHGQAPDVVLLVQCTSPFLTADDVDAVASEILTGTADTSLTAAPFHGFIWRPNHCSAVEPAAASVGAGAATPPVDRRFAVGMRSAKGDGGPPCSSEAESLGEGGHSGTAPAEGTPAPTTDPHPPTPPQAPPPAAPPHGAAPAAPDAQGVNHDKTRRPRRQDRPAELLETGAAYAMDVAGFRHHRHRFFGVTTLVPTDPARVLEIDDPHDLARARALAPLLDPTDTPTRRDVDAVVLDFDGTQTDDRVLIDADGREMVAVHRGDGLGVAALRRAGLHLLILSTERNAVVAARARKLHVPVLHGIDRKDAALKHWCEEYGIDLQRVLYAGNDVNDLPCLALVGWPVAVADAQDAVRAAARAVTTARGGAGAIREIAGWLLGPTLTTPPRSPQGK